MPGESPPAPLPLPLPLPQTALTALPLTTSEGARDAEGPHHHSLEGLDLFLSPMGVLGPSEAPKQWPSLGSLGQDGTLSLEGQLERRWLLWHEFMRERSLLDDWLQRAEQQAASPNTTHVLHAVAREELSKFEALQGECGARVSQLDSLTVRSRSLLRLFDGAMRARLVAMTKECGQRWERLSQALDCICRRLRHCVSQREAFDVQREEMAVWLADMDLRLTELEHFSTNNTVTKMHQLQSFQEAVAENASRLGALLESGEALIQRSEPTDAQAIEGQLHDLLHYCARVFEGVGRLHTRLLSMRLVFEDDWTLSPHVDSGCPSETPPDDEEPSCDWPSSPKPKTAPSHPACQVAQDSLMLEWDPSVDIGGSTPSNDDADSSYFSGPTGVCQVEEFLGGDATSRRRHHLKSSLHKVFLCRGETTARLPRDPETTPSGLSDCSSVSSSRSGSSHPHRHHHHGHSHPVLCRTSTPAVRPPEPLTFDPQRVTAWLGQTGGPVAMETQRRPCSHSKSVQTEHTLECFSCVEQWGVTDCCLQRRDCAPHQQHQTCADTHAHPAWSHDSQPHPDWSNGHSRHSESQSLQESPLCPDPQPQSNDDEREEEEEEEEDEEEGRPLLKACAACWSEDSTAGHQGWSSRLGLQRLGGWSWSPREVPGALAVLGLLMGLLLVLLAVAWYPTEPSSSPSAPSASACHRANRLGRSFHLALTYVNGPPPT
ncbi:uncharacterized protein si:ch211-137a8.2 isoform X2 [Engraulis encrasicolus]